LRSALIDTDYPGKSAADRPSAQAFRSLSCRRKWRICGGAVRTGTGGSAPRWATPSLSSRKPAG